MARVCGLFPGVSVSELIEGSDGPLALVKAANTSSFFEYQSGARDSYFSVAVESVQVRCMAYAFVHGICFCARR